MMDELEDLHMIRLRALENIEKNKLQVAKYYNKKVKVRQFAEGDLVWKALLPRESLLTNRDVIYDQVAPVSKRTRAEVPQTKNLLITTSGASAASSSVRWFNLPRPAAGGGAA
jgi:hypothetical protein